MLEPMVDVLSAINDAPRDDFEMDDDEFSVERLQAFDQAMKERQMTAYRLVARRRSDQELAGHTLIGSDRLDPAGPIKRTRQSCARTAETGSACLLKTAMLDVASRRGTQIEAIAPGQRRQQCRDMIAVNDAIGCKPVGESQLWQTTPA